MSLSRHDKVVKNISIHRIVAITFIPNPENLPEVNHIDEIKTNNNVDNLEWCDRFYNINYGLRNKKHSESVTGSRNQFFGKHHTDESKNKMSEFRKGLLVGSKNPKSRPVILLNTGEIFNTATDASSKYKVDNSDIGKCCRNKKKYAGKHPETGEKLIWKYCYPLLEEGSKLCLM